MRPQVPLTRLSPGGGTPVPACAPSQDPYTRNPPHTRPRAPHPRCISRPAPASALPRLPGWGDRSTPAGTGHGKGALTPTTRRCRGWRLCVCALRAQVVLARPSLVVGLQRLPGAGRCGPRGLGSWSHAGLPASLHPSWKKGPWGTRLQRGGGVGDVALRPPSGPWQTGTAPGSGGPRAVLPGRTQTGVREGGVLLHQRQESWLLIVGCFGLSFLFWVSVCAAM